MYSVLARSTPGPAGAAALARYTSRYRSYIASPQEPVELVNFGQSVSFPLLFGVTLSLFGAATMVHLLLVSVNRRRAEAGLLKVLGFVRRQVAAVVGWQATVVALVGIAAGVPLGIAAGKIAWRLFATNFGVVPVPVVPAAVLAVLACGVLVAANALAAAPSGWRRDHARPSCSGPSDAGRDQPAGRGSVVALARERGDVELERGRGGVPAARAGHEGGELAHPDGRGRDPVGYR